MVVVSDIRRKTDIKFFEQEGYNLKTIRIEATETTREKRGWHFQDGVDNVQSECDLDDFTRWHFQVKNNNVCETNGGQDIELFISQLVEFVNSELKSTVFDDVSTPLPLMTSNTPALRTN